MRDELLTCEHHGIVHWEDAAELLLAGSSPGELGHVGARDDAVLEERAARGERRKEGVDEG